MRSVPGPDEAERREAAVVEPARPRPRARRRARARPRPGRARRAGRCGRSPSRGARARRRARGRGRRRPAQAGLGHGTTVQLTWPPMITATPSRTDGRRSRAGARRVDVVEQAGRGGARERDGGAAPSAPISTMRAPYQGGTQSSVSSAACCRRASLTRGIEPARRPRSGRRGRRRPRRRRAPAPPGPGGR